jgi:hypothetical protein
MTTAPTIPAELITKALQKGWISERSATETIELALAKGFSLDQIGVALDMGLTPERASHMLEMAPLVNAQNGDVFNEQQHDYIDNLKKGALRP